MKNNVIALPVGRIRRDTAVNRRKQSRDPDLFVDLVESNPGHIARREARREAHYRALALEREETDRLLRNVGTGAMFATLTALLGWGLWL